MKFNFLEILTFLFLHTKNVYFVSQFSKNDKFFSVVYLPGSREHGSWFLQFLVRNEFRHIHTSVSILRGSLSIICFARDGCEGGIRKGTTL